MQPDASRGEAQDSRETRVFLSYARADAETAHWLRERLEASGIEVFRDIDQTLPGEQWWARLMDLIAQSDTVVFLLSPKSAVSQTCADEVAHALELNKRIFPVTMAPIDWAHVPAGLARIHSVDIQQGERRDAAAAQLTLALQVDIVWLREHTRLLDLARHWHAGGRDSS